MRRPLSGRPFGKERNDLVSRQRLADIITLRVVALQGTQFVKELPGFHTFRADFQSQLARKQDCGFNKGAGFAAFLKIDNETLVDLELAKWQFVKCLKR